MFGINRYAFWSIVVISLTLLLITILITLMVMYNIKQKYNSINLHISQNISYKEELKQYNDLLEKTGITSKKKMHKLFKLLEVIKK